MKKNLFQIRIVSFWKIYKDSPPVAYFLKYFPEKIWKIMDIRGVTKPRTETLLTKEWRNGRTVGVSLVNKLTFWVTILPRYLRLLEKFRIFTTRVVMLFQIILRKPLVIVSKISRWHCPNREDVFLLYIYVLYILWIILVEQLVMQQFSNK